MELHKLLKRQIKKFSDIVNLDNPECSSFIRAINDSYNSFERDKELSSHSFKISEREYQELNESLLSEVKIKRLSINKLKSAIENIDFDHDIQLTSDSDNLLVIVDYLNKQINKRKEVEEKLHDLSLVAEETSNMVVITDADQKIVWVNKAFNKISGYTLEEVKGRKPGRFLQGVDTDPKTVKEIRECLRVGNNFQGTILNYNKAGGSYWNELSINPIKDEEGRVTKFISISNDVTERITKNERLLKSELRWKVAMEGSGGGVFEYDVEKDQFVLSNNLKAILGQPMDLAYVTFDQFIEMIAPESRNEIKKELLLFFTAGREMLNKEISLKNTNGTYIPTLIKAIPTRQNENGQAIHILGTTTNITEITQTKIELANSVRQFKGLSENIPAAIFEFQFKKDGSETFKYVSPAIEKLFGMSPKDYMRNVISYTPVEDRDNFLKMIAQSKKTHESFHGESRLNIPGKGNFWQYVSASYTYKTQAGDSIFTGIISDITSEKKASEALRMNEDKYKGIIANMNLGLLEMNKDEKITFANNAFCSMSSFTLDELMGKDLNVLHYYSTNEEAQKRQDHWEAHEIKIKDKLGRDKWWLASKAPSYNEKGNQTGFVCIYLDISEQKELEIDLVNAREEAIKSSKAKETFLANMSHEIRTPLNGIIGMIRELSKLNSTQKQTLYISNAQTASQHLLSVINNILDLSKMESGAFELAHEPFSLSAVFGEVKSIMKVASMEKGLEMNFNSSNDLARGFIGDSVRIRQVLLNIISNSVKFTEDGFVNIDCDVITSSQKSQDIVITITDSGIGMDQSFLETIFSEFTQENDSSKRGHQGTGLGMAISYQLVQLMNGEISVTSQKRSGSTFEVKLPLTVDPDFKENTLEEVDSLLYLAGKKILLVEDNELNRLVVQTVLDHQEANVIEAVNGADAVLLCKNEIFDLILMDLQMPVMDGFEATRLIREKGIMTPIVALTANALKSEIEKCMQTGMNDFITKPFEEENFLAVIMKNIVGEVFENSYQSFTYSHEKLYNLRRLKKITKGNDEAMNKLTSMFCNQITGFISSLNSALDQIDIDTINKTSHKLKYSIAELEIESIKKEVDYLQSVNSYELKITESVAKVNHTLQKVLNDLKH